MRLWLTPAVFLLVLLLPAPWLRPARSANLTRVSVTPSTARFGNRLSLTVRFSTVSAVPDGSFRILVPAAESGSNDGTPDPTGWDFGGAASVTCPDDVDSVGHHYDFSSGQAAAADVVRAGRSYHRFECPYSGSGGIASLFDGANFRPIVVNALINPSPAADHEVGLADTYPVIIEQLSGPGGEIVDATAAEVAVIESVRVTATVLPPGPPRLVFPPLPGLAVILFSLVFLLLLLYPLALFALTGNPLAWLLAFLAALLRFFFLPWPPRRHELREQTKQRLLPWCGFRLVWQDKRGRQRSRRLVSDLGGRWETPFVLELAYAIALHTRGFEYPADQIRVSEVRPTNQPRWLYLVGESFWLYNPARPVQPTTIERFSIAQNLDYRFVVWARQWRPVVGRLWLYLPRLLLVFSLVGAIGLLLTLPAWWTIILAIFIGWLLLRDVWGRVPQKLEVYVA